ncbi:MAG: aminotransferase class I/II-fold pyridoxal phosphate-dependent enzyme, partial [Gemmiger sp.]
ADAMARTAALCGAARTWYLVNGSTCGLLAGIRALAPAGSEILAARNCHKSVYHAIELGGLRAHWLTPPVVAGFGVYGSVPPDAVESALTAHPGAACVVLTSPTYEGVLSDIASIAAICHRHGVPLLVDEAHGAHLGLFEGWPQSAVRCGADVVVQSAHKTLPSLTQTALLHLNGTLADPDEIERQLDVFETSSPSYPLLASLDGCTGLLAQQGEALFAGWRQALAAFDEAASGLRVLRLLCHGGDSPAAHPEIFRFDPGKLPVDCSVSSFTGASLAQALRSRFGFETEMACGQLLLAMTSPADSTGALTGFAAALCRLDAEAAACPAGQPVPFPAPGPARATIAQALAAPAVEIPLQKAAGYTAAEYVWAYPPGVPLLAPGEEVTPEFCEAAAALAAAGTRLHHSRSKVPASLKILAASY